MKNIYQASDLVQAQLIIDLLSHQWIPAVIENVHQVAGLGELAVNYPQIWLKREQDTLKAMRVIEQFEANHRTIDTERICSNCQEPNPVGFDWCWSCKADLG